MRILVLSDVPPAAVGGAEVQARQLALRWAAAGHDVTVAGFANRPCVDGNLRVIRIPTLRQARWLRAASYLIVTVCLLWRRRRQYDLIYCRFLKEHAFAASVAKIIFKLPQPVVACPESAAFEGDASQISRSPLRGVWTRVLGAGVSTINMISGRIEQQILTLGLGGLRISRIPNGVTIPTRARVSRPERDAMPLRLLFVGRLVEEKGLDTLIDALALLVKGGRAVSLRLVGDGPLRTMIENHVRQSALDDCVTLVGALPPDAVADELCEADLFVLPSRCEGLPVALLEAIAHGLPAVATRVSGSEEIIDDSIGWLVPADDLRALAGAIEKAIDRGRVGLRAMGERAREKAVREYDIDDVARRYTDLFSELLDLASTTRK